MAVVVVVGGGIAGLGAALGLARQGHTVKVLEQDDAPLPASPVEAFEKWERRGAPQLRHSHAFLARLRNDLRERAPDVLDALLAAGAEELHFCDLLPSSMTDREPRAGDAALTMLACRRVTFEWVLRRAVEQEPGVAFQPGTQLTGLALTRGEDAPRVTGVRLRRRGGGPLEELDAELVVDAAGRRSPVARLLEEAGGRRPDEEREPCGIFYCSRFFRLRAGVAAPESETTIGADLGYLKYAIFHGDARIFSVTLAASPDDAPLRALRRTPAFEAVAAALPALAAWTDRAEPLTEVHSMASLFNTHRVFCDDAGPVARGLVSLGDAAIHTNPLYGRGCTLAWVHAGLLSDAVARHGIPGEGLEEAFDAATRREILPWYELARRQDRDAADLARLHAQGQEPDEKPPASNGPVDPKRFLRSLVIHGLLPALRSDPDVARAFFRSFNCLVPPTDLLKDPAVMQKVLACYQTRHERQEPRLGPRRRDLLEILAAA